MSDRRSSGEEWPGHPFKFNRKYMSFRNVSGAYEASNHDSSPRLTRTSTLIFSLLPTAALPFPATRSLISPAFHGQLPNLVPRRSFLPSAAWKIPAFDFVSTRTRTSFPYRRARSPECRPSEPTIDCYERAFFCHGPRGNESHGPQLLSRAFSRAEISLPASAYLSPEIMRRTSWIFAGTADDAIESLPL